MNTYPHSALVLMLLAVACRTPDASEDAAPTPEPAARSHATASPEPEQASDGADATPDTKKHRHHGGHHRFEDAEAWAKHFDDPERDAWQKPDDVVAWLGLAPGDTVVDLGAGTGYFTIRLAKAVPEGVVYGNDIEPDMVRYLGERAEKEGLSNVRPVKGSADDPAVEGPVNLAFMCDVYHHIEDRSAFFGRVAAALGDDGRLVILDFRKDAPEDAPGPPRAMRIAADDVVRELESMGFALSRREQSLLPYQYILEFTRAK